MGAGSCWPGTWGPADQLFKISGVHSRLEPIDISQFHQYFGQGNSGSLSLGEGAFHGADKPFSESIRQRVVWT